MDVLSRLLALAPVSGRLEVRCHFGAPWRIEEPPARDGEVPYHVLLRGEAVVESAGAPPQPLRAGDVVLFARGCAHVLRDASGLKPKPARQTESEIVRIARNEGRGDAADILCGRFLLPASSRRLLRSLLPDRLVVHSQPASAPDDALDGSRLARLVSLMREEATEEGPGSATLVNHLSAALFALALRFAGTAEDAAAGLLALGRHPRLQPAVLAMFDAPQRPWTLPDLAALCHLSRATLVRQFQETVGQSPAEVLAEIRMAFAARALVEGNLPVADIGESVGYFSDAAFQRAFKQRMGLSPARWRATYRGAAPGDSGEAPGGNEKTWDGPVVPRETMEHK